MAVNIIGNEVEDNNNSVSPDGEGGHVPSSRPHNSQHHGGGVEGGRHGGEGGRHGGEGSRHGEGGKHGENERQGREEEAEEEFPFHHDLAFSMYVDTGVTAIIQQLQERRAVASRGMAATMA